MRVHRIAYAAPRTCLAEFCDPIRGVRRGLWRICKSGPAESVVCPTEVRDRSSRQR